MRIDIFTTLNFLHAPHDIVIHLINSENICLQSVNGENNAKYLHIN
jgi:hypothetical protein